MEVSLVRLSALLTAWICAVLVPLCPVAITAARGEESPSLRLEAKIPLGQVHGPSLEEGPAIKLGEDADNVRIQPDEKRVFVGYVAALSRSSMSRAIASSPTSSCLPIPKASVSRAAGNASS